MKVPQKIGRRGSLMWVQRLVHRQPASFEAALRTQGLPRPGETIHWLSPLGHDQHAEYRDEHFLECIGCESLTEKLKDFWPSRGPQWDALARTNQDRILLVEAKAHGDEMRSSCHAYAERSLGKIGRAIDKTKAQLGVQPDRDWLNGYYQYANRLAHLTFLRESGVDAWLIFLYFVGDEDMEGPADEAGWKSYLDEAYAHLGLPSKVPGVVTMYQSIDEL
jgi:hypothetical protein